MTVVKDDIQQTTFLGASVIDIKCSIGFNQDVSSLVVNLVEDDRAGQIFTRPTPGSPAYFQIGDFTFNGIVQNWVRTNSKTGNPIYQVTVFDPRIILQAAKVILGEYGGPKLLIPNLIDVYGYYERQAFGLADRNDAGMYWRSPSLVNPGIGIEQGITTLIAQDGLNFRGNTYYLDWQSIQSLPIPGYYRIGDGGAAISLLELIARICDDANVDFLVTLEYPNTIKVRLVDLNKLPATNAIEQFIADHSAYRIQSEAGRELIDPDSPGGLTAGVLFGGNREDLQPLTNIWPFWGFQPTTTLYGDSLAVVGQGYQNQHRMDLNALSINDIIGVNLYNASIFELKAAMAGQDVWTSFLALFEPAKLTGIVGDYEGFYASDIADYFTNPQIQPSWLLNENALNLKLRNSFWDGGSDTPERRINRVYDFVNQTAQEYFGKQFAVLIPFATEYINSETFQVKWSYEPTDSAWYDSVPTGLDSNSADFFSNDDGKYSCILVFELGTDIQYIDPASLEAAQAWIQNGKIFVKADVDPTVFLYNGFPAVNCKLSSPIYLRAETKAGNYADLQYFFTQSKPDIKKLYKDSGMLAAMPSVHPGAVGPQTAWVPLKNNTTTYGPYIYGVSNEAGGVKVEQNTSLTPWNYGSTAFMDIAGTSAWFGNWSNPQRDKEFGSINIAGEPELSLGDELITDGPIITNINVNYDTNNGVTTSYQMATYIPRFGRYEQYKANRIGVIGATLQRKLREFREIQRKLQGARGAPRYYYPRSPLDQAFLDGGMNFVFGKQLGETDGKKASTTGLIRSRNVPAQLNTKDDAEYKKTALMSTDGLYRPFSTNSANYVDEVLATFEVPLAGDLTSTTVNPFQSGHDIAQVTSGDTFKDNSLTSLKPNSQADFANIRAIALRGPLVIAGWGWDIRGKPVPNENPDTPTDEFMTDHLQRSDYWKAAPVDLKFDHVRKVWTTNGLCWGVAKEGIGPGSSGLVRIDGDDADCTATNKWAGLTVQSGKTVLLGVIDKTLYILDSDC